MNFSHRQYLSQGSELRLGPIAVGELNLFHVQAPSAAATVAAQVHGVSNSITIFSMRTINILALSAAAGFAAPASIVAQDSQPASRLTEDGGQPAGDNQNSRTAGPVGSVLLDNFHLIQKLARFDRERIPERVVHARGAGAHGEYVSYNNLSNLTKAKVFSEKDKKRPYLYDSRR